MILILLPLISGSSLLFGANLKVDKEASVLSSTMHASPSHDFTSIAQDYHCDIEIDPETLTITKAFCSFKFTDLNSGKKSRDEKMCKWMNVEKFPEASFVMTDIESEANTDVQIATGKFKMHGVVKEIRIPFTVARIGEYIQIEGTTEIDHKDWGLKQVRLLLFSVDTKLRPYFRIKGTLKIDD